MNWSDRRSIAPEPHFSALLKLLETVFIRQRSRLAGGKALSVEETAELQALMDALHNVPAVLGRYGGGNDEQLVMKHFAAYTERARERGCTRRRCSCRGWWSRLLCYRADHRVGPIE